MNIATQWRHALRFLLLLAWVLPVLAGGRITGIVTDKDSGDPLTGVNVVVKGSYRGAATDLDGRYTITDVPSGSVDLELSCLGYRKMLVTAVPVLESQVTEQNMRMEPALLAGEDVVIVGKKPLYEVDNTSSSTRLDLEEIQVQVVEDITDVVEQQVGVTESDNEIHIRGGRADENLYIIDGLSVKDPVSGQGTGVFLSAEAIKEIEVITGGFNAEYGEAMSGVIDVKTREGSDHFFGNISWKRDNLTADFPVDNQNEDVVELSLGGPMSTFGLPGTATYFFNGYGSFSDTYLPHATELYPYRSWMEDLDLREENNLSAMAKIAWRPTPLRKLAVNYGQSVQINQGYFVPLVEDKRFYPYEYEQNLDHYNTFTQESRQFGLNWVETLSNRTWLEFNYGWFYINQHSAAQNKNWEEYNRHLDINPTWYLMNPDGSISVYQGDGFYEYGDTDFWHDHYSTTHTLKGEWNASRGENHELKSGFQVDFTELQLVQINSPWLATEYSLGRSYDAYNATTTAGAFFLQDKITYQGMNVNIGFRLDFWRPGSYLEDIVDRANDETGTLITEAARDLFYDETFAFLGGRWKAQLSPRLGISHPVTDNDMLFFSYGHFSQRPKYSYVYANLESNNNSTYSLIGNPNLNPTTTVAYEVGLKHRFNANSVLQLTAFYKDMYNYVTAFSVDRYHPRYASISYTQYWNIDYARSRGLELSWRQRFEKYWSFNWNATVSVLTGKSSSPSEDLLHEATVGEQELGESYLSWDKPYVTSANVIFYVPESQPLSLYGHKLPVDWGFNLRFDWQSGKRYSPQYIDIGDPDNPDDDEPKRVDGDTPYTELSDPIKRIDLKVYKDFDLVAGSDCRLFIEIQNLFNWKTVSSSYWINTLTGSAWEDGDPFIANNRVYYNWSEELSRDGVRPPGSPARYKEPRQVVFGISIRF